MPMRRRKSLHLWLRLPLLSPLRLKLSFLLPRTLRSWLPPL
jgi:hypothetical protein